MALQRTRQVRKGLLKEETVQSMVNGTQIQFVDSCPMPIMGMMHTKNNQGYRGRLSYSCGVTCLARRCMPDPETEDRLRQPKLCGMGAVRFLISPG